MTAQEVRQDAKHEGPIGVKVDQPAAAVETHRTNELFQLVAKRAR